MRSLFNKNAIIDSKWSDEKKLEKISICTKIGMILISKCSARFTKMPVNIQEYVLKNPVEFDREKKERIHFVMASVIIQDQL